MAHSNHDITLVGVSKSFGGVSALTEINLKIKSGEVHALVGENGVGKSTLGKIIAGVYTSDSGTIQIAGKNVHFRTPREAIQQGVVTIAQELAIVPGLSVSENVLLGEEPSIFTFLRKRKLKKEFNELASRVGFKFKPETIAGSLSVADQQKLEILRALSRNAKIIIMDEPTAALSRQEAKSLHSVIKNLTRQGTTVILVSHFLSEVLELSDTITVLRDGQLIASNPARSWTQDSLIESMLGRSLDHAFPKKVFAHYSSPTVMFVNNLNASGVNSAWLSVRAGEIVGIAGLVGSGRSELARAIFHDSRIFKGSVEINGRKIRGRTPRIALNRGVALLPESRKDLGLLIERSIKENISLSTLRQWSRFGWVSKRSEMKIVNRILEMISVRHRNTKQKISELSGGNQQKVLFARMIVGNPRVLIVDEPTRGVDVGSKSAIYDLLVDLAKDGMAVVVISSDLEEVMGLAHRILVMRNNNIVAEFSGRNMTETNVLAAAFTGSATGE